MSEQTQTPEPQDPEGTSSVIAAEQADGDFRLVFNTGASAGQTVFHVHAHVLAGGKLAEGEL